MLLAFLICGTMFTNKCCSHQGLVGHRGSKSNVRLVQRVVVPHVDTPQTDWKGGATTTRSDGSSADGAAAGQFWVGRYRLYIDAEKRGSWRHGSKSPITILLIGGAVLDPSLASLYRQTTIIGSWIMVTLARAHGANGPRQLGRPRADTLAPFRDLLRSCFPRDFQYGNLRRRLVL